MTAFYNEIDPYAAQWLRNLIVAGHIAPGVVDERNIEDIEPAELVNYTQCHFFAGIGAWSYALRLAGWPDDRPVWTGSCPCQPFSAAGKGAGFADERHLWPAFHHLISECRPPVVFGEQVASKNGLEWLDLVQADLEGSNYATGAADLCAAGIGAPHIRQRLYWVADREYTGLQGRVSGRSNPEWANQYGHFGCSSTIGGVVDPCGKRCERYSRDGRKAQWGIEHARSDGGMADTSVHGHASCDGLRETTQSPKSSEQISQWQFERSCDYCATNENYNHWRNADWLNCRDGKWRPVEPGTFPLAHGTTARVGRLRAYGNAIVPQVAQAFIESYLESQNADT